MRKSFLLALVLACLMAVASAPGVSAQELGNSVKMTPKGQFSLGASMSYVFEQENKDYDLDRKFSDGFSEVGKKSSKFKNDQYYLLGLTYGVTDWLNVFAQAGVVSGGKSQDHDLVSGADWESSLGNQFVWAVGAKAQAFKLDNGLTLGLSARYLRYDNRKVDNYKRTDVNLNADTFYAVDDELDFWQVDLNAVVSRTWGMFTPYVGLGYTHAEAKLTGHWIYKTDPSDYIDYEATMKNDQPITALCGLDVALGQGFSLYVQGVFLARTSVGAGLTWSF